MHLIDQMNKFTEELSPERVELLSELVKRQTVVAMESSIKNAGEADFPINTLVLGTATAMLFIIAAAAALEQKVPTILCVEELTQFVGASLQAMSVAEMQAQQARDESGETLEEPEPEPEDKVDASD